MSHHARNNPLHAQSNLMSHPRWWTTWDFDSLWWNAYLANRNPTDKVHLEHRILHLARAGWPEESWSLCVCDFFQPSWFRAKYRRSHKETIKQKDWHLGKQGCQKGDSTISQRRRWFVGGVWRRARAEWRMRKSRIQRAKAAPNYLQPLLLKGCWGQGRRR